MVGNYKGCEEGVNANVALYTLVYPRRGHSSISSVHPVDPEAPMVVIGISDVIVVFLLHKIFISFRIIIMLVEFPLPHAHVCSASVPIRNQITVIFYGTNSMHSLRYSIPFLTEEVPPYPQ